MPVLRAAAAALAWLGRQGTRAIAAVVLIGIAVPPLGALLRPFVTPAIFVLLCNRLLWRPLYLFAERRLTLD